MNRVIAAVATIALALTGSSAIASVSSPSITINGTAGPVTVAPSSSLTAVVTLDVTNSNPAPLLWTSTEWEISGSTTVSCSNEPNPAVAPALGVTASGTATLTGITAPSTEGNHTMVFAVRDGLDCTGNIFGVGAVTITVAAAPPVVSAPEQVPALPLGGALLLGAGLLFAAGRKLLR
jgi:hypothetical protein